MTTLVETSQPTKRSEQAQTHSASTTSGCCLWLLIGNLVHQLRLRVGFIPFSFIYTQQRAAISLPSLAETGSGLALGTLFTQIKEGYRFPPEYLSLRGHTLYCIWSLSSKINQLAEESGVFPTGQYASRVNG